MSLTETSKFIALILRHKPQVIGIELDQHGWAKVSELIAGVNKTRPLTMEMLEEIVKIDEKQRYSFNEDKTLIRANQGHSVPVDVELTEALPPEYLYHGTCEKNIASIDKKGLLPMKRLYVHLSANEETAIKVGKRRGTPFVYRVASGDMSRQGYKFYLSANGVWLTKAVPTEFLIK